MDGSEALRGALQVGFWPVGISGSRFVVSRLFGFWICWNRVNIYIYNIYIIYIYFHFF